MKKKRKLFCEYGPICYKISLFKESFLKDARDFLHGRRFSKRYDYDNFEYIWKGHAKMMLRNLHGVDMELQKNKVTNLRLAAKKLDGIVIDDGKEFSFWNICGDATKKKGYLEGLVISNGVLKQGVGGGLCQMANLIHWLVLHTPLTVTEIHHHSDALFPDSNRREPFGTGTSICYKALDYRFKNDTGHPIQLRVWLDDVMLYGEIRSVVPLKSRYRIVEEDHHYSQNEEGIFFRNSLIFRTIENKESGETKKELILKNHSKVMYDYSLIPSDEIRR